MLAATLTTAVVFFPVTFLYGVSQFLFSALALAVVLALFASYAVAMTVVPLFCARFIKARRITARLPRKNRSKWNSKSKHNRWRLGERFNVWFNDRFESFLRIYDRLVGARAAPSLAHACCLRGLLRCQPRFLSLAGSIVLSHERMRACS